MDGRETASKRTLERALSSIGDSERLAELLGVDIVDLNRWVLGKEIPQHKVFLRALDLAFKAAPPSRQPKVETGLPASRKSS